jgi:Zn-dependent M28 family amino/carboxypeptidase
VKAFRIGFRMVLAIVVLTLVVAALWMVQPLFRARSGEGVLTADPERLARDVRMLADVFTPRDLPHGENLDRAADYMSGELRSAGARVSEQGYIAAGRPVRNILAMFGPDTPERIVVGAHYDAFGGMPGADDNASGAAGLLELARLLSKSPPPVAVELVAYTLEEPPHFNTRWMGSAVHAESLRAKNVRVRAMLCLEMIGCFSDEPGSQRFPVPGLGLLYPTRGDFIAVAGRLRDARLVRTVKAAMAGVERLRVRSINAPPRLGLIDLGLDLSDHSSYWAAGMPAVMVTDTAFFRNSRYHMPDDTPETLDYERMALVVSGVHQAVLALGGPWGF